MRHHLKCSAFCRYSSTQGSQCDRGDKWFVCWWLMRCQMNRLLVLEYGESSREEYSIKHLSCPRRWGKALGCQDVSQTSWVVASLIIIWSHWTLNHYCLFSEVLHLIAHLKTGLDFTSDCTWRRVKPGWMDMGLTVYNRSEVKLTSFISCASMQNLYQWMERLSSFSDCCQDPMGGEPQWDFQLVYCAKLHHCYWGCMESAKCPLATM